jgi:SAM-dependent methyltransferase
MIGWWLRTRPEALMRNVRTVSARLRGVPTPEEYEFVGGNFEEVGKEFARYFSTLGALRSSDRALDIGCGIGRIARPLTRVLERGGTYDGFDIVKTGIDWCQRHITSRHPHFLFQHVDLRNGAYNPRGQLEASTFRFPYADATFTFACAISLFTHLPEAVTVNYLRETARVLAPGGRALLTFFLLNETSRACLLAGTSSQAFVHAAGAQTLTTHPAVPERAVAYDEEWVRGVLAECRLTLREPVHHGSWSGRPDFVSYQDIVVVSKSGAP